MAVIWSFPGDEITLIPSSSEDIEGNFRAQPVGVVGGNFTSALTFPAENGTVITCFSGDRSIGDSQTVTTQGIPMALIIKRAHPIFFSMGHKAINLMQRLSLTEENSLIALGDPS